MLDRHRHRLFRMDSEIKMSGQCANGGPIIREGPSCNPIRRLCRMLIKGASLNNHVNSHGPLGNAHGSVSSPDRKGGVAEWNGYFETVPYLILLPNDPIFTIVAVTRAFEKITRAGSDRILGRGFFDLPPSWNENFGKMPSPRFSASSLFVCRKPCPSRSMTSQRRTEVGSNADLVRNGVQRMEDPIHDLRSYSQAIHSQSPRPDPRVYRPPSP